MTDNTIIHSNHKMKGSEMWKIRISKKEQAHHSSAGGNQFLAASGKQISRKTVARRLRGGGLYARRPVVCVPLTRQHRTARLQWCREHHNWTEQDWACVLFSDENLNPIENVGDALGRQVAGRNYPHKQEQHPGGLTEEWDKLPQQLLDNVVVQSGTTCGMLHHTPRWTYPVLLPFFFKVPADF
ncbi:hypothetical protein TNCV_505781 [Trichonephila clavipes]|nr:hypothetical protein TNCV_505781 [Trichonephila clavipes]